MKKVLIVGATTNGKYAVASILNTILSQNREECEFFCFGYDSGNEKKDDSCFIHNKAIADPYKTLFYRGKRKLYYSLQIDDCRLTERYAYRNLVRAYNDINFDAVYALAGRFGFINAAYRFAKQKNLPLSLVYFDPFTNNVYAHNPKARLRLEARWLTYANSLFYNAENIKPNICGFDEKVKPFKIPISVSQSSGDTQSGTIVYGGSFYRSFRTPERLYHLSDQISGSEYRIKCYSNLTKEKGTEQLAFLPQIDAPKFKKVCEQAAALIYIGNKGSHSKSSKYLEFVALRKPIIGVQVEPDNEVRKYPFYIDADANVGTIVVEIERLQAMHRESYDPYETYPDRNPMTLFIQWFLSI